MISPKINIEIFIYVLRLKKKCKRVITRDSAKYPKKISIKKLFFILFDKILPKPAIDIDNIIIPIKNNRNSSMIIKLY